MSAPTSGSSGSSSAASPVPGYYPDPSIPNYIRFWNGSSWVPGTSRPASAEDEPVTPSRAPVVDESGPMFLDEDPAAPTADQGAPAEPEAGPASTGDPRGQGPSWPAPQPASQLPPISWGQPAPEARQQPPAGPVPPQGHQPSTPQVRQAPQPAPQPAPPQSGPGLPGARAGQPFGPPAAQPLPERSGPPAGQAAATGTPWAEQVQDLARGEGGVVPWRPVASDPFGMTQSDDRPGGLLRRFAARVIDTVLLVAVTGVAAVPLGSAAYHHAKDKVDQAKLTGQTVKVWLIDGTTGVQLGAVLAVFLVASLLVEVLPTAKWGRTPGKKLVGLRVLDIEAQLPPGFGTSLRRWLTHTVLDLVAVGVVGVAWCLFDRPWKQCWHDKAARTFVAGV
jgi:hypothetical protein